MPKVTNAESAERVTKVFELLVLGLSRQEIMQYCSAWEITTRQIDVYIQKATERLKAHADYQREEQLGVAINRLNKLYRDNLKVQDYKGALAVQKELNLLLGLHAPSRHEVTGKDGEPIVFTLKFTHGDEND